ncbi:MAG: hypothetical protein AAF959_11815 [Cyanobacteria bacterium P01_D01_bin.56]
MTVQYQAKPQPTSTAQPASFVTKVGDEWVLESADGSIIARAKSLDELTTSADLDNENH